MANERYIHKIGDMVHDGFTTAGTIVDIQKDNHGRLEYHVRWHTDSECDDLICSGKLITEFKQYLDKLKK